MARKVHVWRVQNESRIGPYWAGEFGDNFDTYNSIDRSPSPANDGGLQSYINTPYEERKQFFFGFQSPRQMRSWFVSKERRWLANNGFRVTRYTVSKDDVIFGNQQVVFRLDRAVAQCERKITSRVVQKIGADEARSYKLSIPPGFDAPIPPIGDLPIPF